MLFLDWEKAFDKISHTGLHSALASFGLDPMYLRLIDALYARPQFTVAAGGQQSTTHLAHTGIRQGCPLSPCLFLFAHSTIMNLVDQQVEQKLGYCRERLLEVAKHRASTLHSKKKRSHFLFPTWKAHKKLSPGSNSGGTNFRKQFPHSSSVGELVA